MNNLVDDSSTYGGWSQHHTDVTLNLRVGERFVFVGGTSLGRLFPITATSARLPELSTTTTGTSPLWRGPTNSRGDAGEPYCRVVRHPHPIQRPDDLYGAEIEVQASATFQSTPGAMLAASRAVLSRAVARTKPRQRAERHRQPDRA